MLGALIEDIDAGIAPAIGDPVRGEVFGDFLSHAEDYLRAKRVAQAGVIAGVVFEDTIRRACDRHKIPKKSVKLDELTTGLNKGATFRTLKHTPRGGRPGYGRRRGMPSGTISTRRTSKQQASSLAT